MYSTTFLDLPPLHSAGGSVTLPGSKSISNRVLLLAALSEGSTLIHDLLDSDDTRVMLAGLETLGCGLERLPGNSVRVQGLGGQLPVRQAKLFLGNAGTAMRPLTAALALLAAQFGGQFELSGIARMHERPIGDLVDALRQLGCPVDCLGNEGYPPLRLGNSLVTPLQLDAPIRVRGDVSSQFLTALLLALPLVATRDITLEVVGELISKPYIEITLKLLQRFGVDVQRQGWERFTIPAGSRYRSPGSIHVEGDASSASYFIALGALAPASAGQDGITIQGVGLDSIQGDIRFVEAAQAMGAVVTGSANALHIRRGVWPLKAIELDCNHIPDAAMTLAVMALYADGTTTLRNIASWRVKETDRIAAMACELRKLGATVEEGQDFIKVSPPTTWTPASIHTYDDHRVAMCFSLSAFNPAGVSVRIEDPKCVAKTFPDYFETLFSVVQANAADIPVLCIDGPTASGKGTLAAEVAHQLGYHLLDSGVLYRLVGVAAERAGLATDADSLARPEVAERLGQLAATLNVRFTPDQRVLLDGVDLSDAVRTEAAGMAASRVSALPQVRQGLLELQHSFRELPGLVADGRDMGTVIFPDAPLKVFLTASAEKRAERRHKQLISKGIDAKMADLLADLKARDARDTQRQHAPLKPAEDAFQLDNSEQSIEQSVQQVLAWWQAQRPFTGV
ncbi:MAG TPA: bifunctional 3-phosphoshikimate 1-carboxyvinyltransferase/cytidylate kinase [Macromonas sp.]|nr:bifunctional 3-phosphoshikimate 1-carboxyvinyltransferase/cytidylate kinase [Macromonas sp.]